MVQHEIEASDCHALFTTLLRLDANFTMTPHAASSSRWNTNQVLRPKPKNRPAGGFEAKTTKPPEEAYPLRLLRYLKTRFTIVLNRLITKSSSASA